MLFEKENKYKKRKEQGMKIIIIGPNSGMKIIIIWPEFGAYATISNISCDLSISLMHDVDQALLVSVGCSRSKHAAIK